jgi:hypothetical protein
VAGAGRKQQHDNQQATEQANSHPFSPRRVWSVFRQNRSLHHHSVTGLIKKDLPGNSQQPEKSAGNAIIYQVVSRLSIVFWAYSGRILGVFRAYSGRIPAYSGGITEPVRSRNVLAIVFWHQLRRGDFRPRERL